MNVLVIWLNYETSLENAVSGAKSGGDTHIIEVSKRGDSLGHTFVMLTSCSGKLLLNAEGANLKHHQVGVPFENFLVKNDLGVGILYALRPFMAIFARIKGRFDVIVTSSHYPSDVLSAFFLHLRNPKSKIVVYFHGIFPEIPRQNMRIASLVYNYLGFLVVRRIADMIFIFNKHTRHLLLRTGFDREKLFLTSNGIDMASLNMANSQKLFDTCFLGRLAENKGVPDLVKVWKRVCVFRKGAKLAVMGSGSLGGLLNELTVAEGLQNNIVLLGSVSEARKREVLHGSKIFVFPSYLEGWGIAIAEAMACGLPVVAYNLPVYKETFENKIVTVPLGNVDAMAKQVIFLLENPEVARKIGEKGRELVKTYDWRVVAERELSEIQACMLMT